VEGVVIGHVTDLWSTYTELLRKRSQRSHVARLSRESGLWEITKKVLFLTMN